MPAVGLTTATNLADKFQVSIRTIYPVLRAPEQADVPIITEEEKGYILLLVKGLFATLTVELEATVVK